MILDYGKRLVVYIAAQEEEEKNWSTVPLSLFQYDVDYDIWTMVMETFLDWREENLLKPADWKYSPRDNTFHHFDLKEKKWIDCTKLPSHSAGHCQYLDLTESSMLYIPDGYKIFQWNDKQEQNDIRFLTDLPYESINRRSFVHYAKQQNPQHIFVVERVWPPKFHRYNLQTNEWEENNVMLQPSWMNEYEFVQDERGFFNTSESMLYYGWIQHKINLKYYIVAFDVIGCTFSIRQAPIDRTGEWGIFLSNDIDVLIFYKNEKFIRCNLLNGESENLQVPFKLHSARRVAMDYI